MKRILLFIILPLLLAYSRADEFGYGNEFLRALRISNNTAPFFWARIECKKGNLNFIMEPIFSSMEMTNKQIEDWESFKESDISSGMLFPILFSEYQKNSDPKYTVNSVGILHIDAPSRLHFSFPDNPIIINIELIDPNMKPITFDNLPKNSKMEYNGNAIDIIIFDFVRLWEGNNIDQKMSCDLYVSTA
ncbi:MAG: hypothetical protein LBC09_02770 [Helicobacteraceae bacterium]|jgi:hypothetical protein|nr:hypothetical protein [Helicobacteraceae bacterium]